MDLQYLGDLWVSLQVLKANLYSVAFTQGSTLGQYVDDLLQDAPTDSLLLRALS